MLKKCCDDFVNHGYERNIKFNIHMFFYTMIELEWIEVTKWKVRIQFHFFLCIVDVPCVMFISQVFMRKLIRWLKLNYLYTMTAIRGQITKTTLSKSVRDLCNLLSYFGYHLFVDTFHWRIWWNIILKRTRSNFKNSKMIPITKHSKMILNLTKSHLHETAAFLQWEKINMNNTFKSQIQSTNHSF